MMKKCLVEVPPLDREFCEEADIESKKKKYGGMKI